MAVFVLGENHFRKCFFRNEAVWLVRKILFSENWNPLTQKNSLWPRKCFYTSIFPSKHFRKMRERERESARARERGEDPSAIASSSSSPRSRAPVRAPAPVRGAIAIRDRDRAVVVDDFMYFLGCGLCFLICVFLLLFQTPENIFRKIF